MPSLFCERPQDIVLRGIMQANIKGVAKERDSSLRVYEWGWKQSQSDQNILKEILTESWDS